MTETTKDKVPPRPSRGKPTSRGPTDVEGTVLRARGFVSWPGLGTGESTWEGSGGDGWTITLWSWSDGSVDLAADLRDAESGASIQCVARNIVALFALMERFGDTIWNAPEAG